MIAYLRDWYRRNFSNPQVAILALLLIGGFVVVVFAGNILAPVLAGLVVAYLLDGGVDVLVARRVPRLAAVWLVFTVAVALFVLILLGLVPLMFQQVTQLFRELPNMIGQGQELLMQLPERYPSIFSLGQVEELINGIRSEIVAAGQRVVSLSISSVVGLITFMVYFILVPLLVFFFLKDKGKLLSWTQAFLPSDRSLVDQVWREVNVKIGSYVRGKFLEILIVWSVTYATFAILGLNYAMVLSFMVGVSVIIPYVGAAVVTIPVAFIAYFQWGLESEFWYMLGAYAVIQFLDGNLLVPLLFSEVVNLHPVAIIVAVLVFGGVWGVWGVFFAIPLATLIQAVINSWPKVDLDKKEEEQKVPMSATG